MKMDLLKAEKYLKECESAYAEIGLTPMELAARVKELENEIYDLKLDIAHWCQLALRQRACIPENHPVCPTLHGISKSRELLGKNFDVPVYCEGLPILVFAKADHDD